MVTDHRNIQRDAFHSLADPTRRKIIAHLATSESNVTELSEKFDISRPAISKQIRVLEECGVIQIRKSGRQRICSVRFERLQEVSEWIDLYTNIWNSRLNAVEDYLNDLNRKGNKND